MPSPKVKFCGMTDVKQVEFACDLGVDAIGMILWADSPRTIELERAAEIRRFVPESIKLVGVFVNASQGYIEQAVEQAGLDLIQLHGEETNEFGQGLSLPFIKAIRAQSVAQVDQQINAFPDACALLLDPYVKGQHGGTGQELQAQLWPTGRNKSLVLAGGLGPHNLLEKLEALDPWGIDLNSGMELSPGQKSLPLMQQAMQLVAAYRLAS